MKTYEIYFWHGYDEKLSEKISSFCEEALLANGKMGWIYKGSLDDFMTKYNSKFIVYPDFIAITSFNSFGQR